MTTNAPTDADLVDEARAAAARGDAARAYELLAPLDARGVLTPDDLTVLAPVAYADGHLEEALDAWERAHAAFAGSGEDLRAAEAATRVALHLMIDTGLMAPVRGWIRRAEQLLAEHGETPVHAWLALAKCYERLLSGEVAAASSWARQASALGAAHSEPGPALMGRVAEARCVILEGDLDRGLDLLDDAAVAAVSGDADPLMVGMIYCEIICGWQGVLQFDRAEQWTRAMERWGSAHPTLGSVHGRCRVHAAEIRRLRGPFDEAEQEALRACEELQPYMRREYGWPLTELGLIRLRRGDLDGAEAAFLRAHELGWEPQPGLALLQAERGDLDAAAASIAEAIEHPRQIPSKELPPTTEMRTAPLLEAQVAISVERGDLDTAARAAAQLDAIATRVSSPALLASAALANGRYLHRAGDLDAACRALEHAVQGWCDVGAPFEAAEARLELGRACRGAGDEHRARLELRSATAAFEWLGARRHAARAAEAERAETIAGEPDTTSADEAERDSPGAVGVMRRRGEYWSITFDDRTVHLAELKGFRYLVELLAAPGEERHVLDLVATVHPPAADRPDAEAIDTDRLSPRPPGDDDPLLDARAKASYRRRLTEIDDDIDEAERFGDRERAARASLDREFLVAELARAVGLGGHDRRSGSASERARVSVTRAVRHAIGRIAEHAPVLGEHLERTVRTGTYCSYQPDPRAPVRWET